MIAILLTFTVYRLILEPQLSFLVAMVPISEITIIGLGFSENRGNHVKVEFVKIREFTLVIFFGSGLKWTVQGS